MFGRILILGWKMFAGMMVLGTLFLFVGIFPKAFLWLAQSDLLFFLFFCYVLLSGAYGLVWLYRQGMKRAGQK
jgi:hypothetical membrane protein